MVTEVKGKEGQPLAPQGSSLNDMILMLPFVMGKLNTSPLALRTLKNTSATKLTPKLVPAVISIGLTLTKDSVLTFFEAMFCSSSKIF